MSDDSIAEWKRQTLANRKAERDSNNISVLDSMGLSSAEDDPAVELHDCQEEEITLNWKPEVCKTCYGRGTVKGVCLTRECETCFGTGLSMTDPIAIIKWQRLCMAWAKEKIKAQSHQINLLKTTDEQRLEESVSKAYAGSTYNKHD